MPVEDDAVHKAEGQPHLNALVATVSAPALCLSDTDGQIRPRGAAGLYVHDIRLLSSLVLTINGLEPTPLGHDLAGGNRSRFVAAAFNVGSEGPDPSVFIERERLLGAEGMTETLTLRSYARQAVRVHLVLQANCDLASMGDVKSGLYPPDVAAVATPSGMRFQVGNGASVACEAAPPPSAVDPVTGQLSWVLSLESACESSLRVTLRLEEPRDCAPVVVAARAGAAQLPVPVIVAEDERLGRFLTRSIADLNSLRLSLADRPEDVFLAAGVPWFLTLFGRDSLWAARMLLPLGTELAAGTLRTLASRQGRVRDLRTGEEPGKILHEVRRERTDHRLWHGDHGEPLSLPPTYYGTVDATPLWVCLLHDAWCWGLAEEEVAALLDPMERCLSWIAVDGCTDSGFVSYIDESGSGLANQGWKDSHDGIQFRDGRLGRPPLALCEVQGYAFEAMTAGAALLDAFGRPGGDSWRARAAELATNFRARFWVEDACGRYPAVALDRAGVPVDSLTSNIGHLLGTGILDDIEAELVAQRLQSPALDCGFGLRTLAADSVGYNPLSYHCGSVWCHDSAIAIRGLAHTGTPTARRAARSLVDGLLGAAEAFDYRMPELFGGHGRDDSRPLAYPASCRPQAWSAASSVALLAALVGIRPNVPAGTLWISPLGSRLTSVSGLLLGDKSVTIDIGEGGVILRDHPAGLRVLSDSTDA